MIDKNGKNFTQMLELEVSNLTLPGETDKAYKIKDFYNQYSKIIQEVCDYQKPIKYRQNIYFANLIPLSKDIRQIAEDILLMNQQNMRGASVLARQKASSARMNMIVFLVICSIIGLFFLALIKIWILRPLNRLIDSANQIKQGNLDLVIRVNSHD
ncbi:MAG: HAMP domain-containing histidine kinase, partial [Patescibacteria group bacterium]|nr:HAMP domain-containing histidine kinase [Patescibacteria group bacterium]